MIKRIGEILLVLGLLLGCAGSAVMSEPESVIVQVNVGNLKGSGVIYQKREDVLIVTTAAHVLAQGAEGITVTFSDGFEFVSNDYYVSSHSDLAFINIPISLLPKNKVEKYVPVKVDKAAFDGLQGEDTVIFQAVGTDVVTLQDLPEEKDTMYKGIVSESWIFTEDFEQYMMILQGDVEPGMSGGGVFDMAGNFMGIICGESEQGEVAAVPLSIIEAEYLGVY